MSKTSPSTLWKIQYSKPQRHAGMMSDQQSPLVRDPGPTSGTPQGGGVDDAAVHRTPSNRTSVSNADLDRSKALDGQREKSIQWRPGSRRAASIGFEPRAGMLAARRTPPSPHRPTDRPTDRPGLCDEQQDDPCAGLPTGTRVVVNSPVSRPFDPDRTATPSRSPGTTTVTGASGSPSFGPADRATSVSITAEPYRDDLAVTVLSR